MSTTGERIKELREERGISQQCVADMLRGAGMKWSQATVWAVEAGERNLRLDEASMLAPLLNTSIDWLASGAGPAEMAADYAKGFAAGLAAARKALEALA